MDTDAKRSPAKITYATMTADRMEDLHRELDAAIERVQGDLRQELSADDRRPRGPRGERVRRPQPDRHADSARHVPERAAASRCATRSPRPRRRIPRGARARGASAWRCSRRSPTAIRAHRWELAALMGYEAGKNRLECVGDVEESADLIEYYCDQVAKHSGFETHARHARPRRGELAASCGRTACGP